MPTTIISGPTDIDDTLVDSAIPDRNFGGSSDFVINQVNTIGLMRIATSKIPSGVIKAFRLCWPSGGAAQTGGPKNIYLMVPSATWVEGVAVANPANAGECCWNYLAYNTVRWAGGTVFSAADYVADVSPPTITIVAGVAGFATLKPAWCVGWRNGTQVNNGIAILGTVGGYLLSTDSGAANRPWFEIDWEPEPGVGPGYPPPAGSIMDSGDVVHECIRALKPMQPDSWFVTGLKVIASFGLEAEFSALYKQHSDSGQSAERSCKLALETLRGQCGLPMEALMLAMPDRGDTRRF